MTKFVLVALLCVAPYASSNAWPQAYPSRPVRLIVASAPGGSPDIAARNLSGQLTPLLGQQVVVENRPGASGIIGYEALARATPDGYTFGMLTFLAATNPAMFTKLPYDVGRDFHPVILFASSPNLLAVSTTLPVRTVKELIAHARLNAGKLTFASSGVGATPHLAMELFTRMTGTAMMHVAYKGTPQAATDVIGGRADMLCDSILPLIPLVTSGKLRGLGVTSATRSAMAPELPTLDEAGLPGFEILGWSSFAMPTGAPRATVLRLNAEINKALQSPVYLKQIAERGGSPIGGTPEQASEFIRKETEKWGKVIRAAGIKPQ